MDGDSIRKERYEDYIAKVSPMAAAIGRRVPYHLEYLRQHGDRCPEPGKGAGQDTGQDRKGGTAHGAGGM